jgi:hypothetical protein
MNPTERQLDQIAQNALSREHLRRTKTRLMCPTCGTLQTVTDVMPLSRMYRLACGHLRNAKE